MKKRILIAVTAITCSSLSFGTTVFSNNIGGDTFTNASGSNQGQAIGSSNWYYNNVRNSGIAGIDTTFARNGNGSARLQTTVGPTGSSSKADIELLAGGTNLGGNFYAGSSLGTLGQLSGLSYEWYRASGGTADQHLMVAGRILIDADGNLATTNDRGGLVFETVYNGGSTSTPVATDSWVNESITANTFLWNFGGGMATATGGYNKSLSDWVNGFSGSTVSGNSAILGFSFGVGSGWGTFDGAVDTVGYSLNGQSYDANFEAVPEPATLSVLALLALACKRKKAKI